MVCPPTGTFVSYYVIETGMAVAAWAVYLKWVRKDRDRAERAERAGNAYATASSPAQ